MRKRRPAHGRSLCSPRWTTANGATRSRSKCATSETGGSSRRSAADPVAVVPRPRIALKLIAAATASLVLLGVALVLLVATLMGGLAPQGCGSAPSNASPSPVALADIPGNYLGWMQDAAP